MIYILGKSNIYHDYDDLEDTIFMASTRIDDILDYLYNNVNIDYLSDYTILVKVENDLSYETICPNKCVYANFVEFTPSMFLKDENKSEFEYVKNQLFMWNTAIEDKHKKLKEERERAEIAAKEKKERELYEKLKAKYGG